jgi:dienelactone hydrolase
LRCTLLAWAIVPAIAHADVPVSVVHSLFNGEKVSIEDTLAVADEFRTGVGAGVWQDDCLAKYFYKLAIDAAAAVPGLPESDLLQQAAADYAAMPAKACQVAFSGPKPPDVPLQSRVLVNGQPPGGPRAAATPPAQLPRVPAAPAGMPLPRGAGNGPALAPPVESGLPINDVMTVRLPAADPSRPPDRFEAAAIAPVIIQTAGGDCRDKWTLYGHFQEAMRDYARMSFFVYAGGAPIGRTRQAVDELEQRIAVARLDARYWLKPQLAKAQRASEELIARAERKRELAAAGYTERADLYQAFFRATKLDRQKLESEDFDAAIYERGGEFVVVFRGTSLTTGWISDARQILNFDPGRGLYQYADQLLKYLINTEHIDRARISTTGHSLGGGLAVYSHLRNDTAFALTFNPAELGAANNIRAANPAAQKRVINYMSYVPGTDASDFVSQGTKVAKELVKSPLLQPPDGHLYGSNFYLPIPVGASEWELAKLAALAGAAAGGTPGGFVQGLMAAAGGARIASTERGSAAKSGMVVATGSKWGLNAIRHPILTAIGSGAGAVTAYQRIAPIENLAWGVFQMHIMNPLENKASSLYVNPQAVVCAGPPTPAFVRQQLDTSSRVGNFLKLAAKIGSTPN